MPNSRDFNHFEYNPVDIDINRSMFDLNHSVKWSANLGEVVPFDCFECLPGDSFSVDTSKVIRLQPMVAPMMDEVVCDVYWFFVPHRLVWNHFKEFMGENTESAWAPTTEYSVPRLTPPSGGWSVGSIADYLGVPPLVNGRSVSALPFRSYALICDQWFRSEAIMDPVHCFVDDENRTGSNGNDQVTDIELGGKPFIACKYFDYFTGCLPAPQRGTAASVFPADIAAPVIPFSESLQDQLGIDHPYRDGRNYPFTPATFGYLYSDPETGESYWRNFSDQTQNRVIGVNSGYDGLGVYAKNTLTNGMTDVAFSFNNLFAQLPASTFNINDLRQAFAVQRYLERSARFGGRYISFVKGFFGVDSPDARLQRTEYLGGSRLVLNVNQVTQNSASQEGSTPLGNVAGMSVTADKHSDFTYSCTEHGLIIGCAVLRHHPSYQQGLNRMFDRKSFTDFYLPTFAHLGEQNVLKGELYYNSDPKEEDATFGYQERWAEYRYLPNRCAGELRSVFSNSLDMWHLADYYESAPTLSAEWLREDKSVLDRVLAVTSEVSNQAIFDFYVQIDASRPLPLYSIPGLIDHN